MERKSRWRSKYDSIHTNCGNPSIGLVAAILNISFLLFRLPHSRVLAARIKPDNWNGDSGHVTTRFSLIKSLVLLRDKLIIAGCHFYATGRRWSKPFSFLSHPFSPPFSFFSYPSSPPNPSRLSPWPLPRSSTYFFSGSLSVFFPKSLFSRVRCERTVARLEISQCKSGAISSNQIIEFRIRLKWEMELQEKKFESIGNAAPGL